MIHKIKASVSINRLFWEDAQELAKQDNVSMSEYVSQAVAWYNGKHREAVKAQEREDQKKEAVQLKRQSLEIEQKRLELGDLNNQYSNNGPQNKEGQDLKKRDPSTYETCVDWAITEIEAGSPLQAIANYIIEDYRLSKYEANQVIADALTKAKK